MSASNAEPVAIVGMGCRFPGGVESSGGLWRLAAEGRQMAGPVPAGRWEAAGLAAIHDPGLAARAGYGCFLDGDVWAWEPEAFSVAPVERRWVDPQFRLLMEVAWEAVEHAGIPMDRMRGSRTGVYMGTYAPDNLFREARPVQDAPNSPYLFGNFTAGAAGRVAFAMDLRGPVMVVSTHCSSGLVALDTACGALALGECDAALAGGVLLMLSPETHFYEAPLLLSERGACHAFDARADGYVRGEGAGVLLLRRLSDARRDGDRVLAVIRGSAVNNDGQASRLTAPSTQMQQEVFRRAVDKAGIDPGDVGLVEAHGPGTAVGDPIEYTSINAVYGRGRGRCALGSIKTNIGHSEPVSGIAGMIKVVECLRRGAIPPNHDFQEWNPSIPRDEDSRLFVPTELTKWPVRDAPRLAAVCSYGVTGTNVHAVVESAPRTPQRRTTHAARQREDQARLFLLSANSTPSLAAGAVRLGAWAESEEGRSLALEDVAHTLALHRSHADHRAGVVARDHQELATRARAVAAGEHTDGVTTGVPVLPPEHAGPVFVFTGQGSQRPGMCRGLLATEPMFAAALDELEPLIQAEAGFSLREMITKPEQLVGIDKIQPVLFAVQVALAALWRSWGIEPAAVIGQSLGEVAAAVVSKALSPKDGAKVICRRSALLATISGGAMASVMLGAAEVQAAITAAGAERVALGVLTSPQSTVVSGDAAQIAGLVRAWEAVGIPARMIDVDVASHSPQVDPILAELRTVLRDLPATRLERPPRVWAVIPTPSAPAASAIRGLIRSVAYEHPELAPSVLEFTHETPYGELLAELLDTAQPVTEIALRPGERSVARIAPGPDLKEPPRTWSEPLIRPGAAYLVTGGLGGLGLLTVQWLARRGAGRIVISGRSAPSARTRATLDALRTPHTSIDLVQGDISAPGTAARAVTAAQAGGLELRGVLHAAGVVEDTTLAGLDPCLLERVWQGKAAGAWSLHRATQDLALDFFVLYSSIASLTGSPGQSAYAAANGFLDGLVANRVTLGLPATGIHWGAWSEVGRGQHLAERGFLTITPANGIDALERILTAGYRQIGYSPLDIAQWIAPYPALRSSILFASLLTESDPDQDDASAVREQLLAAEGEQGRREILETLIMTAVRDLLGGTDRHIGPHSSLVALGLDSLGAVQLQQHLQRALKTEMKPGVIWVKPSAAALTDWILDHMGLTGPAEAK
ncbi:type I polyketide synthase [Streptomyces sp. NPDC059863]|uniref:type I polyketide synthase n=1 Tax=unclassified Streptomyces TaxID=2593676 RepID=UPI00365922A6